MPNKNKIKIPVFHTPNRNTFENMYPPGKSTKQKHTTWETVLFLKSKNDVNKIENISAAKITNK